MDLTLHPAGSIGVYWMGHTGLAIMRRRSLPPSRTRRWWQFSLSDTESDEKANWAIRNSSLLNTKFMTLREARETLEAVLSCDPLPEQWGHTIPIRQLRRCPDGSRRFQIDGADFIARRSPNGVWIVKLADGTLVGAFSSLWLLRVNRKLFEDVVRGLR